ncbi:NUDIX hydrolase [Sphingomonas floccifaciens]|uniref:NUDIX hydrolase n=1 Tax=Sphingomonas floccifaciens TaxID=1844115 RepID=A0ABW4ND43_9SPHN
MSVPDSDAVEQTEWAGKWLVVQRRGRWEYVSRVGMREAAVIVAVDNDGNVLLVDQYRVPIGRRVLELPAGLVDDGEDVETTAARELEEETGYRAGRVSRIGDFITTPGMSSECVTLVRAEDLTRVSDGGGEPGEGITVHRVPMAQIADYVAARRAEGMAIDAKLLLLLGASILG